MKTPTPQISPNHCTGCGQRIGSVHCKCASPRARYILENYKLEVHPGGFVALSYYQGRVWAEITGCDRAEVCRQARAQWGHFNYGDEAAAFATIFPVTA